MKIDSLGLASPLKAKVAGLPSHGGEWLYRHGVSTLSCNWLYKLAMEIMMARDTSAGCTYGHVATPPDPAPVYNITIYNPPPRTWHRG